MKHQKLIVALIAILIVLAACRAYVNDYYRADESAAEAMADISNIRIEHTEKTIAFIPENAETGFIFYPGGKVEATAYAPLMHALAEENVLCVLTKMPFHLAVLDMSAAEGIPQHYPQIGSWYIGGHSLGGSMAGSYVEKNADQYEGLVLLASYSIADLSQTDLKIISIYGSEDGVLNMEKYADNRGKLPASLEEHIIEGGCHAGFGSYGPQDGDGTPSVTPEEQVHETVRLLTKFFFPDNPL